MLTFMACSFSLSVIPSQRIGEILVRLCWKVIARYWKKLEFSTQSSLQVIIMNNVEFNIYKRISLKYIFFFLKEHPHFYQR